MLLNEEKISFSKNTFIGCGVFFCDILIYGIIAYYWENAYYTTLGATCVIAFVIPDSIFAHPRNIIGGYLVPGIVGLLILATLGLSPLSYALSVACYCSYATD